MRLFAPAVLLAPPLLALAAHSPPALQIQAGQIPALTSQDWASVLNAPSGASDAPPRVSIADHFHGSRPLPLVGALRGFVTSLLNAALSPFPFPHTPWGPHHGESIDLSHYTIGDIFKWILDHPDKPHEHHHHSLPLHRLAWLINQSEPVQNILSDPDADLTFFAPDDEALTPPHKRHARNTFPLFGRGDAKTFEDLPMQQPDDHIFWQALASGCPHSHSGVEEEDEDKEKKEKKKEYMLHLLQIVLTYHVSPGKKSLREIADHATLPSALHIEPVTHLPPFISLADESSPVFRIRVGGGTPFTKPGVTPLNFYTELGGPGPHTIIAKNGVIHLARKIPLIPPFTPLAQLFIYPKRFSTLTSALQQAKLDDILLPSPVNESFGIHNEDMDVVNEHVQGMLDSLVLEHKPKFEKRSFTVFAPTNRAFLALGPHVTFFLFSPFGARVLRYILSYHIVPDIIWYTDHVDEMANSHVITSTGESGIDFLSSVQGQDDAPSLFRTSGIPDVSCGHPHVPFHPSKLPWDKANVTSVSFPTLLGSTKNVSLSVSLVEFKIPGKPLKRQVFVNQPPGPSKPGDSKGKPNKPIPVIVPDAVAWGGAIHVIPSIIRPPVPPGHPAHDVIQSIFSGSSKDESKESLFV